MAIAYNVGTAKGTNAGHGRTGDGDITITLPTGWDVGDYGIIVVYNDQGDASTPTNWTEITGSPFGAGTEKLCVFVKRLESGESNPVTTISGSTTNASHVACIATYSGAGPIGAIGTASNGTGTPMTAGSITTTGENSWVLGLCGRGDNENSSGQTFGGSTTGVTERLDGGTTEGNDSQVSLYDKAFTTASSASGDGSATTSTTDPWVSVLIELLEQDAPSVTLNSPADASSNSDTTPNLDFTGTDDEDDDIRYNVQIDTVNTFDSQLGDGPAHDATVVGSANGSNSWTLPALSTAGTNRLVIVTTHTSNTTDAVPSSANLTFVKIGSSISYSSNGQQQVYRAFATAQLSSEVITITGTGFPQVTAVASTFSGTDTTGTNGSGAIGDTDTTSSGGATTASATVTTTRDNSLVIGCFGETANQTITAGTGETQTGEATGVSFSRGEIEKQDAITSSSSTSVTNDVTFGGSVPCGGMVIEILAFQGPLLDKISGTDSGFANPDNGGDTDPFNSGENIQYTVQSALSVGTTYYWRVRAIDPTGSNSYGAWSTTRSFSVIAEGGAKVLNISQALKRSNYY